MVPDDDGELIRVLATGDPGERREALGQLFDRHQRRVFNVAWRVLGDRVLAEDVVQEVFTRLPRVAKGFRGDASLTSWLYRVTVNRAIDRRRREARRPARRFGDTPIEIEGSGLPGRARPTSPEGEARAHERAERVQAALLTLSPKLRAVAVLRYVEGLSYEELAEAIGCSLGTIKSRLNRAHTALAAALADFATAPGEADDEDDA
jgi:RNA polymerase sigma-70 factor (ECF subfamily)